MPTRDEDVLLRLAEAVAQGTPVDWAQELAAQPELRPELEQLRALEAMAALPHIAAPDPLLGRQLSHYRIRERLGAGGMGVVYRAEDQRLHRPVALKVLPPELVASEERRRRLLREARAGAAVVHPSVAAVHEIGEDQGTVFVAMELVEGETLHERIAGGPLPLGAALQIATEMADGLAHAHRAHVIHRDLKPANVVIRPDGHVKILDFGLAKLGLQEQTGASERSRLESLPTQEGRLLGTPAYMSPEQVRGEALDARSDLFSFGSTLYEMVTGRAPFRRASAAETLTAILRDEPTPPSRLQPELPPRLEEILGRCLAKDPAQRYPGAGELAAELRALASASTAATVEPPTPAKTRRLAAILFSDIVGYTALMEADEGRAIAVRDRHRALLRPIVERFHGELIETPGDEALAVFASSLRAVDGALALQAALRGADDLKLRIGIHVGDVLFRDGEVVGEGVNVAARIRPLAEPGGICVSGSVYEQVKNHPHLHGRSLGSRSLKNVAQPIEVFALSADAGELPRARPRRAWLGLAAGAAMLLAAGLFWLVDRPPPERSPGHSLAVLPFVNLSADPDQAYFAEGIAEELLHTVARFEGLRVIGRTSSFSFRNSDADLRTIGEALGADVILEGSVRRAGNRVRITAQLVDADDGIHRWSESYDRELGDIFAIQTEIATAISTALRVELSPEQRERLATAPTRNLAAYQAYLLGNQHLARGTTASVDQAIGYFQRALELDPELALAYVGLTKGYIVQHEETGPAGEMLARAQAAADKALELDDGLAEAHAALGQVKWWRNDFEGAEASFQRALALNPNSVDANILYGDMLGWNLARYEEALALHRKAVELDPLSIAANAGIGESLEWLGRFDEGLGWYERALEIDPGYSWGYGLIALHHWFVTGRLDEAVVWWAKVLAHDPGSFDAASLGSLFLELGDADRAESLIHASVERDPGTFWVNVAAHDLALHRGDEAAALEHARKASAAYPVEFTVPMLLRDRLVRAGRYAEARALFEEWFPELLSEREPTVDARNYRAAIDLALILSSTGEGERADLLLDRSLQQIERRPRLGRRGHWIADVQLYTLKGEKRKALSALRRAIDEGWRAHWWYLLHHKPDLESLHAEPAFQAMREEIRADMAAQLERVREMERRGELALAAEPTAPSDRRAD